MMNWGVCLLLLWMILQMCRLTLVTVVQAINYPLIIVTIFLVSLLILAILIMWHFVRGNTRTIIIIGWSITGLCMMLLSILVVLWVVAIHVSTFTATPIVPRIQWMRALIL